MQAPTSSGFWGMGNSVGAALSLGESGPDFITMLACWLCLLLIREIVINAG